MLSDLIQEGSAQSSATGRGTCCTVCVENNEKSSTRLGFVALGGSPDSLLSSRLESKLVSCELAFVLTSWARIY